MWSQPNHGLLYEEDKQESTQIEGLSPYVATKINQSPEGAISTMVVVKWSDSAKGPKS